MALTVWYDAVKRLGEKWGISPHDASEEINEVLRTIPLERSGRE